MATDGRCRVSSVRGISICCSRSGHAVQGQQACMGYQVSWIILPGDGERGKGGREEGAQEKKRKKTILPASAVDTCIELYDAIDDALLVLSLGVGPFAAIML